MGVGAGAAAESKMPGYVADISCGGSTSAGGGDQVLLPNAPVIESGFQKLRAGFDEPVLLGFLISLAGVLISLISSLIMLLRSDFRLPDFAAKSLLGVVPELSAGGGAFRLLSCGRESPKHRRARNCGNRRQRECAAPEGGCCRL